MRMLFGLAVAVSKDVAAGLLVGHLLGQGALWAYPLGMLFALLPDMDAVLGSRDSWHRRGMHYPLVMIPLAFAVLAPFSLRASVVGAIALFFHYISDTVGDESEGW